MAQAVVPAMQCQMGKPSVRARPAAGRMWGVRRSARGTSGFKVLALGTETTGVVQRMNQLLDMDTTPFTDKIIAEYIWYVTPQCCRIITTLFASVDFPRHNSGSFR